MTLLFATEFEAFYNVVLRNLDLHFKDQKQIITELSLQIFFRLFCFFPLFL